MTKKYEEQIDIDELFYRAIGKTEEETENILSKSPDVPHLISTIYGVDVQQYYNIVKDLIKLTPIHGSLLIKKRFHAFVDNEKGVAIAKLIINE